MRSAFSTTLMRKRFTLSSKPQLRQLRTCSNLARLLSSALTFPRSYRSARGCTHITDLEMKHNIPSWIGRVAKGFNSLRVDIGMYTEHLSDALSRGLKSGDDIPGGNGLLTVGPYKIITVRSGSVLSISRTRLTPTTRHRTAPSALERRSAAITTLARPTAVSGSIQTKS